MTTLGAAGRPTDRVGSPLPAACGDGELATTTVEPVTMHPLTARPAAGRIGRLRARLGSRDLAVLRSLARLRLLTGEQVQRLHVGDGSPATRARRARAFLQRLSDLRLVVRLGRRIGGVRAGSSGYIYGLSGHGQAVLAIDGPHGARRRRVWETSPAFQDHVLDVAEVYVRLVEAERAEHIELLAYDAEPPCWRTFPGAGGQTVTLKPDAYVRLGIGELERSAFLEVDRGTESAPTLSRKCGVYIAYWHNGGEQARHGVFPSVLWLASNARGAGRIAAVVRRLPADAQHLFEVMLLANAIPTLTKTAPGGRMA